MRQTESKFTITRLPGNPSLTWVPEWVKKPLGRYYLYFADHKGKYIRLAYADQLTGPWKVHAPGVLPLAESYFTDHVASPEVIVDQEKRRNSSGLCATPRSFRRAQKPTCSTPSQASPGSPLPRFGKR